MCCISVRGKKTKTFQLVFIFGLAGSNANAKKKEASGVKSDIARTNGDFSGKFTHSVNILTNNH